MGAIGLAAVPTLLIAEGSPDRGATATAKGGTNTVSRPWNWRVVDSTRFNSNGIPNASAGAYFKYLQGDGRRLCLVKRGNPFFPNQNVNAYLNRPHPFSNFGEFSYGYSVSPIESTSDGMTWISGSTIGRFSSRSNQWEYIQLQSEAKKLSRDGRYVFSLHEDMQHSSQNVFLRFDTVSQSSETLGRGGLFSSMGLQCVSCSADGSSLLVRFTGQMPFDLSHPAGYALWKAGIGFVSAPRNFSTITGMSADGLTLAGESLGQFPAIARMKDGAWTVEEDRTQRLGVITHMSADATVRIRALKPAAVGSPYIYWVDGPNGRSYRLSELLPPLVEYTNSRLIGWGLVVHALSDDGRTLVAGMLDGPDTTPDLSSLRYLIGVADFVFPGEERRLRLEKANTGDFVVQFPTTTNQVYQVKSATDVGVPSGQWRNVGGASRGTGKMMEVAGSTNEATALFRLEISTAP